MNFDYILNVETDVKITLLDAQGKAVKTFPLGLKAKGYNQEAIDVSSLNSGLYLCRIGTNSSSVTQKILITH